MADPDTRAFARLGEIALRRAGLRGAAGQEGRKALPDPDPIHWTSTWSGAIQALEPPFFRKEKQRAEAV
jgi:hypothetical protein